MKGSWQKVFKSCAGGILIKKRLDDHLRMNKNVLASAQLFETQR